MVEMLLSGEVAVLLFGCGSGDLEVEERSMDEMMLVA